MLKKSFVFMMLLAASLIGISSAAHHQPEVAIAQPQTPQQQQPQVQSPNIAPNIIGKRLTSPQEAQKQSNIGTLLQIQQDKALVDRLFPYIIQKIDGKTLLQKIDARTLAAKVLPYLDIENSVTPNSRGLTTTIVEGQRPFPLTSHCAEGSVLTGGGFSGPGSMINSYVDSQGKAVVVVQGNPKQTGYYAAHAYCLSSELVAK
jgi:hypothetical protein